VRGEALHQQNLEYFINQGDTFMCKCGCSDKPAETKTEETAKYYCAQCNAVKEAVPGAPKPECCGKKMSEVD
jgi:hypothetical protein